MPRESYIRVKLDQIAADRPLSAPIRIFPKAMPSVRVIDGVVCDGYCCYLGIVDGAHHFEIGVLRSVSNDDSVRIIVHEWRHIEQRMNGWLVGQNTWNGHDYSTLTYWDKPWEIDARQFEKDFTHVYRVDAEYNPYGNL